MNRRDLLTLLFGSATGLASFPTCLKAQQSVQMRNVGVLTGSIDNALGRERLGIFLNALSKFGWTEGDNLRVTSGWGQDAQTLETSARELLLVKPDVILAGPTVALLPIKRLTQTIPIVFVQVSDPLGQGIVTSLARPGGNITGFSNLEFSLVGKWLQILKEASPSLTSVGLMIAQGNAVSSRWYQMFKSVAVDFSVEPIAMPVKDAADIEQAIIQLGERSNSALIIAGDTLVDRPSVRKLIVEMTAKRRIPALYGSPFFAQEGGFIVYAIDPLEQYRKAANYVDRILKGEKPGDLPVQQPTTFHFVINLRVAKALGLSLSPTLVAAADRIIE